MEYVEMAEDLNMHDQPRDVQSSSTNTVSSTSSEGWGWNIVSNRQHWLVGTQSLCGKWTYRGSQYNPRTEPNPRYLGLYCKDCLTKVRARGRN